MNNIYDIKSIDMAIKDVSFNNRTVKVVLSKMGVMDRSRDVIMPGAFAKSLIERGVGSTTHRKIQFLRHHDWTKQIGKWLELSVQGDELVGVGKLGTSDDGDNALKDYDEGIIDQHSIGFRTIADKIMLKSDELGEFREILEIDLWEGSAVAFGDNEHTPTLEVTKGNAPSILADLNKKSLAIAKALHSGNRTDEHFYYLEMQLKRITELYNQLINIEPEEIPLKEEEPIIVTPSFNIFKHLK